jgi:hypothetical protein
LQNPTDHLKSRIQGLFDEIHRRVSTENGEWTMRGFIDIYQRIYPLTSDTKVVSKLLELMLFPILFDFAAQQGYAVATAEHQNHYPDLTLTSPEGLRFAIDIKTTYRIDTNRVNGMTLGAFTGYFRERHTTKNISFPYSSYHEDLALGVIYTSVEGIFEQQSFTLDQLSGIPAIAQDFQLFVQEKYRIASDRPGSGNTKNIGSITQLDLLARGQGPFSALGQEVFDDYWMFYLTNDMARAAELPRPPYRNLNEYLAYRGKQR